MQTFLNSAPYVIELLHTGGYFQVIRDLVVSTGLPGFVIIWFCELLLSPLRAVQHMVRPNTFSQKVMYYMQIRF